MRVLLLAGALAIAAVSSARADGTGVIAVSTGPREAVATAMAEAVATHAARVGRVVGDAPGEARTAAAAGAVPVERLAAFRRVRDQVDEGWRAYLRVAVELAAQRLAVARTEATALVALPGGIEVYADCALRLGAVLGHLGRKAESQAVLALALALDPGRPITLAEFSPDVLDLVEGVRRAPPVLEKVAITSTPAGAQIRVDARDVGRAPLTVELARGQHLVVARLPQHEPEVQGIAVDGARSVELALEPDRERAQLAIGVSLGMPEPAQQALIDASLRYADLDEVVVVAETTRRGGPTLLVQRCAGLPARCSAVVEVGVPERDGLPSAARSAWQAVRGGELRYPPSVLGERGGRTIVGPRCAVCRSPWLWGGVGAALVVGTVITIVATSGSRPPPVVGVDPGNYLPR